ncbi:hypothetical protein, partial [Pseudomonas caspiana]|uniref:hypothetical protein n=1 Tax=Pseudomonas caspiana TaxID=1451454 RepID=UPI001EE77E25
GVGLVVPGRLLTRPAAANRLCEKAKRRGPVAVAEWIMGAFLGLVKLVLSVSGIEHVGTY